MITDIIFNAFKNLKRKKLRSFLMMLGIIIGITSVTTVLSIGKSGEAAITDEFDRFGLNGLTVTGIAGENGVKGTLTLSCVSTIQSKVKDVSDIMPVIYYYGNIVSRNLKSECMVWGIGDNAKSVISQSTIYGTNLTSADISSNSKNCIIDNVLSKKIFGRENSVGKEIQVCLKGATIKFKVKGIVDSKDSLLSSVAGDFIPSFIYIPYTTMQKLYKVNDFDQLVVSVNNDSDIDKVGEKIVSALTEDSATGSFFAENMVKQKKKIENIIGIVTTIVSAVAGVSLIVGGLGIMTIMLAAVTERTREIGIKKAVGATNRMIVGEFLAESVILTLIGGVDGIGLSALIVLAANKLLGFTAEINGFIMLIALIFSAIIGIIFSVYPAKKASELSPITALRYE